ncbi:MAG: hypothetical protein COT84_00270 [Chlamydiae bacterium CG10_big_fil_rev_8_21_14_0_10_35_9]|nr:MAG: hypothetical protein COT84_00270 [Chlamydiae bacterium CG10_big_fil_rev_8_21_14_0_10_35_9]
MKVIYKILALSMAIFVVSCNSQNSVNKEVTDQSQKEKEVVEESSNNAELEVSPELVQAQ